MKSRMIYWSIDRKLITRVNQYSLLFTRSLYKQQYPDSGYNDLLKEVVETVIIDMIYQLAKYGDGADVSNDELLTAVREIGFSVIDIQGFGSVRNMIEIMTGRYRMTNVEIENRYMKLLDDMFEHFTCKRFYDSVMDCTAHRMSRVIMDGIRDDICLLSYNIEEPFIRMRFIYG